MTHQICFQASKGARILGHGFLGVVVDDYGMWWDYDARRWVENPKGYCSNTAPVYSYRAFLRHLRKHGDALKGREVRLINRFIGYDIIASPKEQTNDA